MEVLQQTELKKKTDEAKAWIKEHSIGFRWNQYFFGNLGPSQNKKPS